MTTSSLVRRIVAGMLGPTATRPLGPPAVTGHSVSRRVVAGMLGVRLPELGTTLSGGSSGRPDSMSRDSAPRPSDSISARRWAAGTNPAESAPDAGDGTDPTILAIRPVREPEFDELHRLDRLVFGRLAYPTFALRQLLELHAKHCIVAESHGALVGYCFGAVGGDQRTGWILGLGVLPRVRGAGYARDLIRAAALRLFADDVQEIRLAVYPNNDHAIRLYETLGFQTMALRRDYFGPGGDRLIMAVRAGELREGEWTGAEEIGTWLATDTQALAIGLGRIHLPQ